VFVDKSSIGDPIDLVIINEKAILNMGVNLIKSGQSITLKYSKETDKKFRILMTMNQESGLIEKVNQKQLNYLSNFYEFILKNYLIFLKQCNSN